MIDGVCLETGIRDHNQIEKKKKNHILETGFETRGPKGNVSRTHQFRGSWSCPGSQGFPVFLFAALGLRLGYKRHTQWMAERKETLVWFLLCRSPLLPHWLECCHMP